LPDFCAGRLIGSLAALELTPDSSPRAIRTFVRGGKIIGEKSLVADARIADWLVVTARDGGPAAAQVSLFLVPASDGGVDIDSRATIDPTRPYGRISFDGARAERLGPIGEGEGLLEQVRDRAAVFVACEQVGGARQALERACAYARERMAFGRPIGSFQAVKQLLADMFVSLSIAEANVEYAIWGQATAAPDASLAAARAHVSATRAFRHCSADAIQVHGGAGFMWEVDAHLFYRRSQLLGACLGGLPQWEQRQIRTRRTLLEGRAA
jgi:alkylation response protein AidB-like acyl-CoA dehydrogenase